AGVDEAHLPLRVAQQRVVLDDLAVGARRGDAVAQEDDGVAVAQGEVGCAGGGRGSEEGRKEQEAAKGMAHGRWSRVAPNPTADAVVRKPLLPRRRTSGGRWRWRQAAGT